MVRTQCMIEILFYKNLNFRLVYVFVYFQFRLSLKLPKISG